MRLADYAAGRRFGNGSGGTGTFGASNYGGFGTGSNTGFGATNSNPFGAASSSSTPFGNTQTSGLSSGGLFGNKPTNSLFGPQSTSASTGSLFGTSNTTTPGFGASSGSGFGANNTSSLFGNNQNQNQNKPPGGLFGNTSSNTSTGFGFGNNSNATTNTNPFGGSGGGLFGNNNTNNQNQGSSLFGQNQTQTQQKPLFGSTFGTNTTQSQPSSGLFSNTGSANTGGGMFGNSNSATQSQGGSLFGGGSSNQTSGVFGGNNNTTQKPLFGGSSTNTGGGIFGNSQSQPATSNLFGNNTNQQQSQPQQGSLFGGNNNTTGPGLFGNSNANKPGGMFGNSTTTNNPGSSFFGNSNNNNGGVFGGSQSSQNTPQQQQGSLHASLLDGNPYGQSSIWTGLPSATPQNSGPLATPLTASQRLKESQVKPPPSLRFTGARYTTPPRRQGYGLTYSPSSSAGSTPGGGSLSTSMYGRAFTGGSFGKVVGKSFSASNLRQQFSTDGESVLSPGAFAPGSSRYSSGSIRRLTIDKNVKPDLFGRSTQPALPAPTTARDTPMTNGESTSTEQPNKLKKRVSFDKDTTGGETNGHLNGESRALVRTETDEQEAPVEEPRFPRSSRRTTNSNGSSSAAPEMEQVRGNELAVVPEDRESDDVVSKMRLPTDAHPTPDPKPGDYWMKPSRAEISKMPREKLQNYKGYQVGRHGCGSVTFDGPVDLTTIPLDDVYDKLVDIELRSITVYPEASTKPPRGKGLNVPSTLRLENSWPRNRKTNAPSSATSGPLFEKHIKRLRNTTNTEFVDYDVQSGVWTFRVPHFTRYGLDYDDEDDVDESGLSSLPETPVEPTPHFASSTASAMEVDDVTPEDSSPEDDTFAFKQKIVPGGFNRQSVADYDQDQSFLGDGFATAASGSEHSHVSDQEESDGMNMAGSFPHNDGAAEQDSESPMRPAFMAGQQPWGTPGRPLIDLDGDWAEQLQRTISPRKQNREALREVQGKVLLDRSQQPAKRPQSSTKNEFRTSIDVMNSLFGKHEERMALSRIQESGASGFEV
jgi:nuclear pore complex protein Nup98-Nup96